MRKLYKLHWFAIAVLVSIGVVAIYVVLNIWLSQRAYQQLTGTQAYHPQGATSHFDKVPLDEQALNKLFTILDEVPTHNAGSKFNPRLLIRAVNMLQPLGKEKSLAAIHRYLKTAIYRPDKGRDGIFLVLRVLFEVPNDADHMPPMAVGLFPSDPPSWKLSPRYPIALVDDIPFLVSMGSAGAGYPEQPESHLNYFDEHGKIREKVLVPAALPFKSLEKFAQSPEWPFTSLDGFRVEEGKTMLGHQILRLFGTVYHVEPEIMGTLTPFMQTKTSRQKIIDEVSALKVKWDAQSNQFTFPDGKVIEVKVYRSETWHPDLGGPVLKVEIERKSAKQVFVTARLEQIYQNDDQLAPTVYLKALTPVSKEESVFDLTIYSDKPGESQPDWEKMGIKGSITEKHKSEPGAHIIRSTSNLFDLKEGEELQLQLKMGEKTILSPKYKP